MGTGIRTALIAVAVVLALCAPAFANIIASDSFESSTWNTNWFANSGYSFPSRDSGQAHGGSWSLRMTSMNNGIWRNTGLTSGTPVAVRYWLYDTGSSDTGDFLGLYNATSSVGQLVAAGMQNSGKTVYERRILYASSGAGWNDLAGTSRSIGWHRFDIYYDSASYAAFYVDGVKYYENSGVTSGYTLKYLRTGEQAGTGSANGYLDDIAVITNPRLVTFSASNGSISLSVGGTAFSAATGYYDASETLALTATPAVGYHFVNWTSTGGWSSTSPSVNYTPEAGGVIVTANFAHDGNPVTVNACPSAGGTVTGGGYYSSGDPVTVTATPNPGYSWTNWTDDSCTGTHVVSTSQTYNFNMPPSGLNLYAHFAPIPYNLTRTACSGGSVSGPSGMIPNGTPVTVTATAYSRYCFLGWTTDSCNGSAYVSKDASYTFNMPPHDYTLYANFAKAKFVEDFEAYNTGGVSFDSLDKNDPAGPNQAPNGSGNPWWGTNTPNGRIDSERSHGGNKSLWGTAGNCKDMMNLQYRANAGAAFVGNVYMDWWFYDPLGDAGTTTDFCGDYTALSYYNGIPYDTDYPDPIPDPMPGSVQQLAIGMSDDLSTGYDPTVYQVRIVGDTSGYSNGWSNTTVTRSIGWHHARVVVGPKKNPSNTNDVSFYIDNMGSPVIAPKDSVTSSGYNIIETNTIMPKAGSCSSAGGCVFSKYFHYSSVDEVSFGLVPNAPDPLAASNIGTSGITWNWIDNSNNEDGFSVSDAAGSIKGTMSAGVSSFTESSLIANTQYSRWVRAFVNEYSGTIAGPKVALNPAYTLALAPIYGTNGNGAISCNNGPGGGPIIYPTGMVYSVFTAVNGFGTGPTKASRYLYFWDTSPTDPTIWTGASEWTSGTLNFTPAVGGSYYLHLRSVNGDGVANPSTLNLGPYVYSSPIELSRISDAWSCNDNVPIKLTNKTVAAIFVGSGLVIEETDRTAGIKVFYPNVGGWQSHSVTIYGSLDSSTRPRTLKATRIDDNGPVTAIKPMGMILRSLGGSSFNSGTPGVTNGVGRYNLGLLVRVAGEVISYNNSDPYNQYFYISDGSTAGGVKVNCRNIAVPTSGMRKVTGVISAEQVGGDWVPVILIRTSDDVAPI